MEHIHSLVSHSDIFKLHYKDHIYIFCHSIFLFLKIEKKYKEEDLNRMFQEEPNNKIFSFFTQEEKEKYKRYNLIFVNEQLYWDDTIETIKLKISMVLDTISMFEMYLYCFKPYPIEPPLLYEVLTKNNSIDITKERLQTFLLNIVNKESLQPITFPSNEELHYDYQDIIALDLPNKEYYICSTIGQKYIFKMDEYVYTTNPLWIEHIDVFTERDERKSLLLNSNLLLNTKHIHENNIYLATLDQVLSYTDKLHLQEDLIIKLYFPYVYHYKIHSKEEWLEQKDFLMEENNKKINKTELKNIHMMYDIFKLRKSDLPYKSVDIKSFKISMYLNNDIKFPLEILFKILHATQLNPFVKWNPSNKQESEDILVKQNHVERRENIYRLFTDKKTEDGKKIPFLPKGTIFRLMRDIGKIKSISTLISIPHKFKSSYDFICEIFENGKVNISATFENDHSLFLPDLELLIKEFVNPVLLEIKKFVEQNGIEFHLFSSFYDENIEINELTYNTIIPITEKLNIKQLSTCINNVFNIEDSTENEINAIFKRVANFNKLNSIDSFLLNKIKGNMNMSMIASELVKNFPTFDKKSAIERVKSLATQLQVEQGVRKNRLEIKISEGLKIIIQVNQLKSLLTIQVQNINNIYYFRTLPIYLDSLIRLTQNRESTLLPLKEIETLCNLTVKKPKKEVEVKKAKKEKKEPEPEPEIIITKIKRPKKEKEPKKEKKEELKKEKEKEPKKEELKKKEPTPEPVIDEEEEEPKKKEPTPEPVIEKEEPKKEPVIEEEEEEEEEPVIKQKEERVASPPKENTLLDVWDDILGNMDDSDEEEEGEGPKKKIVKIEEEEDEEDEEEETGENNVLDVTGTKLKSPYYWQKRMETYDPTLFKTIKNDKFNSYSRICPANVRRQPVILTKEELDKIEEKYPDELNQEDILKYSATEGKDYYYICPRYWCFLTNSYITKEDVDKGVCGGIIPQDAKTIPKGKYVYEFFSEQSHGTQENYLKHYPTFHSKKRTDEGYYIPCCNRIWNTEAQRKLKKDAEEHLKSIKGEEEETQISSIPEILRAVTPRSPRTPRKLELPPIIETNSFSKEQEVKKTTNYIIGPERFPIEKNKWGFLPPSIQYFFNESAFDCQISGVNKNIKDNHLCLLRMGVENNINQSFIACLSMIKYYNTETSYIPSIREMKEVIIQSLDLDIFIQLQNGNLLNYFGEEINSKVNIYDEKYTSSKLYTKISTKLELFKQIVNAYENFIAYLRNDDIYIDYTYLWDLITMDNSKLFPSGLNLIILEIPDNDTTMNVEIICPSNHYSQEMWDSRKSSIFIIKKNNQFEPIFSMLKKKKKTMVQEIIGKYFSEFNKTLPSNIKIILSKIIKPIYLENCKPLNSNPKHYHFYLPVEFQSIIKEINKKKYTIIGQVVNFQGKTIGIKAKNKTEIEGVIPCNPTFIQTDYPILFMDENIWNTYENTLTFLQKWFHKNSLFPEKEKDTCNPFCIVVEEEQIIGFLTNTNQFVALITPVPNVSSIIPPGIKIINEDNYLLADIENVERKQDTRRVNYIKKIKYETYFFNSFRNLIKILINKFENIEWRKQIQEILQNKLYFYTFKLKKTIYLLKQIAEQYIFFTDDIDLEKINLESVSCINKNETECEKTNLCQLSVSKKCMFKIPRHNLITKTDNILYYYARMADEILRYHKTNQYIFQPQVYQNFENIQYKLNENEIILIQSMITQEYFASLIPYEMNEYIQNNNFDDVEPRNKQFYDNQFQFNKETEQKCFIKKPIQSILWKKCFPKTWVECQYKNTTSCTYEFIIDILYKVKQESYSILQIKEILFQQYSELFLLENFQEKILEILSKQGKKILVKQFKEEKINLQYLFYSENYFLTNLDIWVLITKFEIPTIIFSSIFLMETNYYTKSCVLYDTPEKSTRYLCLITPGFKIEQPNHFKYIMNEREEIFLLKSEFIHKTSECEDVINKSIQDYYSLKYYLTVYKILPTTDYLKKKGLFNILKNPKDEQYTSPRFKAPEPAAEPEVIVKIKRPKTMKVLLHQKERAKEPAIVKIKKPKQPLIEKAVEQAIEQGTPKKKQKINKSRKIKE